MKQGAGRILKGRQGAVITDILLFCINGIGIVRALMEALLVDWHEDLRPAVFWTGLLAVCAVSVLWWFGGNKRRILGRTAVLVCVYGGAAALLWDTILSGLAWSLQNALNVLNEYYGREWVFQHGAELLRELGEGSERVAEIKTLSLLAALFPAGLLTGLCFVRGKWQILLAWNGVWLWIACTTNVFPGNLSLAICVAGVVLAAARGEFKDSAPAWMQAAAVIMALAFLGSLFAERLFLPVLNTQYDRSEELRHNVYVTVNYRWLPRLQNFFSGYGMGSGIDVTGSFGMRSRAAQSSTDIYRVTLRTAPRRTLYLRGFVGADYSRRQWVAQDEEALEQYYREKGFNNLNNRRDVINITYMAMGDRGQLKHVQVEELLGQARYSLLPYGALVTEDFTVHCGSTLDRQGRSYELQYREFAAPDGSSLPEEWAQAELQYRQYVYDSFLDYPRERLPRLTAVLDQADLPKGDVYRCAVDILSFLEESAEYELELAGTPVGEDFVEYFLFDSRQGYCAHFASAAVLMFRYCGVPARYATGYSVSPQSFFMTGDDLYAANLTGAQAHAWAEVYVDGVGWVPVEATPGAVAFAEDNRTELLQCLGILTGDIELSSGGAANTEGEDEEEEEEEDDGLQALITHEEEEELEEEEDETGKGAGDLARTLLRLLPAVCVAAAAACVLGCCIRRLYWNRRLQRTGGREKAFLLYRNMRNALHVMGCPKGLILTGEAFWERLQTVLPSQEREDYDKICLILEQSSFGNREPSGEELALLGRLHDDMLGRLYLRAPFYKKPAFAGLACVLPAAFRTYSLKRF